MNDRIIIRGLDLKIDPAVQKNCEVYNSSSGATRSVLYFLLLLNVLALIAVINTHKGNWSQERINSLYNKLLDLENQKRATSDSLTFYSLDYRIQLTKQVREYNLKNKIDRYQNVQIPILGNSFDVNNLFLVCGISFIILLVILRFTLTREKNNLRIALESISERYPEDQIEKEFIEEAKRIHPNMASVCNEINKTRRKHHYNFLSMNEIFNLPPLEISNNTLQNTRLGTFINQQLFYFPYIIYLIIFLNDLTTIQSAIETSIVHTIISSMLGYVLLCAITSLCRSCNFQKKSIQDLFNNFYNNNYKFIGKEHNDKPLRILTVIIYPIIPLYEVASIVYDSTLKTRLPE